MNKQIRGTVKPFIRWLGGKRWLIPFIEDKLSGLEHERYIEPFLGGGAFHFHFEFKPAFLSDINDDLINTYIQVRDHPNDLLDRLRNIKVDLLTYNKIRNSKPSSPIDRSVRFLYLNRTAFSGIYRLNRKGEFNVPFGNGGRTTKILWENNLLVNASLALQGTNIFCSDFAAALNEAKEGDLVYCDPTYTVMHNNNGFRKYNEKCFSWDDQERLAKCCYKSASRGACVIVSNAYHSDIESLYKDKGFQSFIVERKSILSADSTYRKATQEYIFIHTGIK